MVSEFANFYRKSSQRHGPLPLAAMQCRYGACHFSNLNGLNLNKNRTRTYANGMVWKSWRGYYHSVAKSQMAIREVGFHRRTLP